MKTKSVLDWTDYSPNTREKGLPQNWTGKMNPDWSLLPPELLQMISEKVMSISDFVRFRAVCDTWRSASSPRPRHLGPQLPWLILPRGPDEESNHSSMLSVYDLSQSRTHILDLPEINDKRICGSSNGWLILEDQEVWLFNPITRNLISLPSLYVEPKMFLNLSGKNRIHYSRDPEWHSLINKVILSSNPGIDPDCFVMALFMGSWELAFCRIGDVSWTVISVNGELQSEDYVADIGYHNGLLYAIDGNQHVRICDIRSSSYKVINPKQEFCYIYPVEGCYDELGLMILCAFKNGPVDMHYMLTWSDKHENWLDLEGENLNSKICFLGFGCHFNCVSLPVAKMKLDEWEGNCLCCISYQSERIDDADWSTCSIKLFDLNKGRVGSLASHVRLFNLEKYDYSFSPPSFLWLTPTLC